MEYNITLNTIKKCLVSDLECTDFRAEKGEPLRFTLNGIHYLCFYEPEEENYLRIVIPNIDNVTAETKTELLKHALELNGMYKNAKFVVVNNSVWIAAEIFLTGDVYVKEVIVVMVRILEVMYNQYADFARKNR